MEKRIFKIFCVICLIAYLILLMKSIIFQYPDAMISDIISEWSVDRFVQHLQTANFIPFRTIGNSLFNAQLRVEVTTLIYNIAVFIPLGFLLPLITQKARKLIVVIVLGFLVSLSFEFVQLVTTLGAADVDDIILRMTGVVIGYGFFKSASAIYQQSHKTTNDPYKNVGEV